MKTVYIAGPITGVENYEMNFMIRERELKAMGYSVFNPVTLSKEVEKLYPWKTLSHEEYMNYLLPFLLKADHISLLDGWEKSDGAVVEETVARATGKSIIDVKILNPRWGK